MTRSEQLQAWLLAALANAIHTCEEAREIASCDCGLLGECQPCTLREVSEGMLWTLTLYHSSVESVASGDVQALATQLQREGGTLAEPDLLVDAAKS